MSTAKHEDKPHTAHAHATADDKAKAEAADAGAGEHTDPKDEEIARLKAACAALGTVCRNLGGNPDAIVKQATEHLKPAPKKHTGPTKKATVMPAGVTTGVEVEYPADAEDPDAAAVDAYKEKAGLWSLPAQPVVEHADAPKKAKKG